MDEIISTIKVSNNEIEIIKQPAVPEPVKVRYERSELEKQLKDIQAQQDRDNKLREEEKAEVQTILDEMDKIGIVAIQPEN